MTKRDDPATTLTIRQARVADARALDNFLAEIFRTARHVITKSQEFQPGFLSRRVWIARKQLNPFETCLLAVQAGKIVGMIESWTDRRARVCHITCFFMAVSPSEQRRGIGKHLLQAFLNWVAAHDRLDKVELHVHDDNDAALALYTKLGFEIEGRRKGAIRYEDGRVIDDLLMAYWPKKQSQGD